MHCSLCPLYLFRISVGRRHPCRSGDRRESHVQGHLLARGSMEGREQSRIAVNLGQNVAKRVSRPARGPSVVHQDEFRAATVKLDPTLVVDVLRVNHGFCRVPVPVNSARCFLTLTWPRVP